MAIKKSGKLENQIRIISALREGGPLSRKTIAQRLDLTRASITQLTNELIEYGLIQEEGEAETIESRVGRKEILINIKEDYWYLLGIDIEVNYVSIGLSTIKGKIIKQSGFEFDTLSKASNVLVHFKHKLLDAVIHLLETSQIPEEKIFYCGIAMVGRKSFYRYYQLEMPAILEYRSQIVQHLTEHFDFGVTMENNVRALAIAEANFFFDAKKESYLYIKFGPGLGSAIVFSNVLYEGVHGQAGEIGRSLVTGFYTDLSEEQAITLEEIVALDFIKKELSVSWNAQNCPYLYEKVNGDIHQLTMALIYQSLLHKEQMIEKLYKKKMKILAYRIYDYKNLLDLDRIYLFFSTEASKILYEYLVEELTKVSAELAAEVKLSQMDIHSAFLAGTAIAYKAGIHKLESLT